MLLIHCPHCAEARDEAEFRYAGQAHIERPKDPDRLDDVAFGEYLYFRKNPRGIHQELWLHTAGCGKYFNASRHTQSYEILETYPMGAQPKQAQS